MKRHGKRQPGRPGVRKAKPKGRYAKERLWFSAEFIAFCQRHHFKPEGIARCILHTWGLQKQNVHMRVVSNEGPIDAAELYDLDSLKDEGGRTDGQ